MIKKYLVQQAPSYTPEIVLAIRGNPTPNVFQSLLWEFGLEEFTTVGSDIRQVIREAREFSRIKGTLKSINMALNWVGVASPRFVRLSSSSYEIDPGFIPNELILKKMLVALKYSVPARGRLRRIFHKDWERIYEHDR